MSTPLASQKLDLARGLFAVTEDALFAVAAAGHPDEDTLVALGKRRADAYRAAVRGESLTQVTTLREWLTELCTAAAPVCPPVWMPMSRLIEGGLTLEGGARGMRALFTSKPSAKTVEQVRRIGSFAVRALVTVLSADGELDTEEQESRAALVASLGLAAPERHRLLFEPPSAVEDLEIPEELEAKQGRDIVEGAFIAAAADGLDPREERAISALAQKLGVRPEDAETARSAARQFVDEQRDVGAAAVDAIRYVLVDTAADATLLAQVAARLFLPQRHRLEPLSALHQKSPITLANRWHLDRGGQAAVLAASWLAALHTDPSASRRVTLLLRHEDIARDLRADAGGALVRERLDRIVENQLQLAALAAGSS
jgi:tellurite resistance protein